MLLYSGRVVPIVMSILVIGCSASTGPKQPAMPAAVIYLDTVTALPGTVATLHLRLVHGQPDHPEVDSLSGFDLVLCYDTKVLTFVAPPVRSSNISAWEYFTYRTQRPSSCDTCSLGTLRLKAIRDLDNRIPPTPPQLSLNGSIAKLQFRVTSSLSVIGDSLEVGFYLKDWSDNSISREGDKHIVFTPDTSLGRISHIADYDTSQSPRIHELRPVLELRSGWIRVAQPIDDRKGDVDLNGIPFQIHDAVIFSNYFYQGYAAFDPQSASEQIAETDCDGDGEPLTRADLRVMIRSITGEDPNGDSLNVPYMDTLWIFPRQATDDWILSLQSTTQLDELWLQIADSIAGDFEIRCLPYSTLTLSVYREDSSVWVAYGTQDSERIFGPELGDRFEIRTSNGRLDIVAAQASRYPGVSMVVKVLQPVDGVARLTTLGESSR